MCGFVVMLLCSGSYVEAKERIKRNLAFVVGDREEKRLLVVCCVKIKN